MSKHCSFIRPLETIAAVEVRKSSKPVYVDYQDTKGKIKWSFIYGLRVLPKLMLSENVGKSIGCRYVDTVDY